MSHAPRHMGVHAPCDPQPAKRRATPAIARPTPIDPSALVPDAVPGIMLVDPRFVRIDPVNARHGVAFDPAAQAELIDSMRGEREEERILLEALLAAEPAASPVVVAHPALVWKYEEKVATLREALNDELVRVEAAAALKDLAGRVSRVRRPTALAKACKSCQPPDMGQ